MYGLSVFLVLYPEMKRVVRYVFKGSDVLQTSVVRYILNKSCTYSWKQNGVNGVDEHESETLIKINLISPVPTFDSEPLSC